MINLLIGGFAKKNYPKELPEVFQYSEITTSVNHEVHWKLNNDAPLLLEFSKGAANILFFYFIKL